MRVNEIQAAFPVADRHIEQGAISEIIAVVEVGAIIEKLAGPKTRMRHRRDQAAIRPEKPGDLRQCFQARCAAGETHPDGIECYDVEYSGLNFMCRISHADVLEIST